MKNCFGNVFIAIATLMLLLMMPLPDYAENRQCLRKTIMVGSMSRSYMIYEPEKYPGTEPASLVIVLHGANASGRIMSRCSGFNDLAGRNNFIVLYPDSCGPLWNDGRVDMDSISFKTGVDDVLFISQLIDAMVSGHQVDSKRVYVAGFSNGGMMALRIGISASEKIAAVACVSGLLPKQLSLASPSRPVPLLMMNGTDDRLVPWTGGVLKRGNKKHGEVLSVLDTVSYWARNNDCTTQVAVRIMPDRDTAGTVGFLVNYWCANPDNEVMLVTIQGGGHTWPGALQSLPELNQGKISNDFNATRFIWNFFSRHKRP